LPNGDKIKKTAIGNFIVMSALADIRLGKSYRSKINWEYGGFLSDSKREAN